MSIVTRRTALLAVCALSVAIAAETGAEAQERPTPPPPAPPGRDARLPVYVPSFPYGADAGVAATTPGRPIGTLRDAIALAYWSNPQLLAERANLRSTDNQLPIARSAYGPTLDLQASQNYQRDRRELVPNRFRGDQGFSNTAALILNQPLYTFGRNRARENGARAQILLGRDSLRLTEAQVLLDVVSAFVSVERDASAARIAQENVDLLDRQYRDNVERFRVREITSTDLQQVETRVEIGRAQLLQAEGQLGVSRSQFLNAVGAPAAPALAEPMPLPIASPDIAGAYAYADANSPLVRAAQSREKISRANIEAARAEMGPRLDLRGTSAYGSASPYADSLRTTNLGAGITFTQPLIDSNLRDSQLRAAKEANEADWRLIDLALRDTREAVATSWNQLTASRASLEHFAKASEAARLAYEGALLQERAGARTTLDVLDLARDLLNVRTNFVIAQANEYLARAQLLAAIGRLEAPLLVPDIRSYDSLANFDRVARSGDVPLLTPALSALDGLTARDVRTDRPIRDPSGALAEDGLVPLTTETPPRIRLTPVLPPPTGGGK
ncbi:TolC family protein [uncultured Sphingomonas sp.]|uniref:TolC family protein n=1 Tax=uncultured Sphingomonas sp. TaxID=158754 RepID=UPI0035CB48AC